MAANNVFVTTNFPSFASLQSCASSRLLIVTALVLAIGLVVLFGRFGRKNEGRIEGTEPPEVRSGIPLFGHLVGMLRWQVEYFQALRYENRHKLKKGPWAYL